MSKNNPHNLKVGDTLWQCSFFRGTPTYKEYPISKIGTEYATIPGYEVYLDTLRNKTQYTALQFYVSKEALIEDIARSKAITQLFRDSMLWRNNKLTSTQLTLINEVLCGKRPFSDLKDET